MVKYQNRGVPHMTRTFLNRALSMRVLAPALAVLMLGGCATDYAYRSNGGGYYYGSPSVQYRYYGGYGYGGYGSYGPYGYPYGVYAYGRYPYGYHRPYYPYYPRYPYYPVRPYPPHRPPSHQPDRGDNRGKSPWRDLDRIEREKRGEPWHGAYSRKIEPTPGAVQSRPVQPRPAVQPRPVQGRPAPAQARPVQTRPAPRQLSPPARPASTSREVDVRRNQHDL